MTDLYTRLEALHVAGHERNDLDLIENAWISRDSGQFRQSAVLAAVTDRPRPGLLLLQRPATMRTHAGHYALPGGKVDEGETHAAAAVREAHEELGISPALVRVIGLCDPMLTGSMFEIVPVLAVVPGDVQIEPNHHEVAHWFEAPLDHVLDPGNHRMEDHEVGGRTFQSWTIRWEDHRIWGATAMVIMNLARRLSWAQTVARG